MKRIRMQARIMLVGLSALLFAGCGAAWAQVVATNAPVGAPVWHGDVATGLSLARGNANTFMLNGEAVTENVWDKNDLKLGADGQYGFNNWGQSTNRHDATQQSVAAEAIHGFTEYKRLFTERFYGSGRIDGFHDDVASLQYRVVVGPAAGYYFIKSAASKLNLEAGPSFIKERLGHEDKSYVTLRVSEHGEHSFGKAAKVWEQVTYLPQVDDFSNYLLNSEVGVEAALNAHFSLRVVGDDTFNSRPALGKKENDVILISSLVYKY
jgi:putative salt-induced outer membrane protein YdiY